MRLTLIFILCCQFVFAQTGYQEVNQKTYDEFVAKNYHNVIKIGEKAVQEGHNFLHLNYRLGIAYFNIADYVKAEKYLLKVYQQNPLEEGIQDYLSATYEFLGKENLANFYNPKLLNHFKVQLGTKSISNSALGDNMRVKSVEFGINPFKNLQQTINYSNINQNVYWGNYNQHQFFLGNKWTINNRLSFNTNLHYIRLNGSSSFSYNDPQEREFSFISSTEGNIHIETITNDEYSTSGSVSQNNYLINLSSNYTKGRVNWKFGFNALFEDNNDAFYRIQTTNTNVTEKTPEGEILQSYSNSLETDSSYGNTSTNLYQIDLGVKRYFGKTTNQTIFNGGVSIPFTAQSISFSINGSLFQKVTPKAWLGLSLLKNQNLNAILQDGQLVNNGLDLQNHQIGIHWQYFSSPKWTFEIDLLKEVKTEYFTLQRYNYNTLLGTFKYKF